MSVITTGGGTATLKSTTAEGQLLEIISFMRIMEQNLTNNPQGLNKITASLDIKNLSISGNFSFNLTKTESTDFGTLFKISEYLISTGFSSGTGGTFKSPTPANYMREVLEYLQSLEANPNKNLQAANNITTSFDTDDLLYSGTFSFNLNLSIASNGATTFTAKEYLS
jgi:hypothetical protein